MSTSQVLAKDQFEAEFSKKDGVVYVMGHLFNKRVWKNYYGRLKYSTHSKENVLDVQQV